ncbi:MAG: S41 family peptidase [bacterium]
MKIFSVILLVFGFSIFSMNAVERLLQPYNLSFEDGVAGGLPNGWYMATKFEDKGFKAFTNNKEALKGNNCLQFNFGGITDTTAISGDSIEFISDPYGFVYQSVDAKDFRGKKIKFKVAVFTENLKDSSNCRLRLTAHFLKDKPSQNFIGDSIPLKSGWNYYEIVGDIDEDADMLNYGVLLSGLGYILIDDVSIEYENDNAIYNVTDNRVLNPQELENLIAFAKLMGNVRYFYPGFEVVELDWEKFTLTGVEYIESAKDKKELVESLKKLFLPIAPGLEIAVGKITSVTKTKPPQALEDIALSWLHIGAYVGIPIKNFSNQLKNIYLPTRQREAPAIQIIDALPLRGKKIRFSAYIKTDVYPLDGHAQLWLGIDGANEQVVVFNTTIDEGPIISKQWTKHWVDAEVPEDASIIRLGLVMLGDGKIWFDNSSLQVLENTKEKEKNYSKNPNFEDGEVGGMLLGWTFPESAEKAGYKCKTIASQYYQGKKSLEIASDENTRIIMPKLNESIQFEIAPHVFVNMPLNNFVDSNSTLPKPLENYKPVPPYKPADFVFNSNDRYSKFAVTTLLWNVYRHFAIGVDEKLKWEDILSTGLSSAATSSEKEFINTLNRMLAQINDGQGKAWLNNNEVLFALPILWRWIGNELVVYHTTDTMKEISLGSVIKTINNISVDEQVRKLSESISGHNQQWKKLRAAALLKAGSENESVKIQFLTTGKITKEISLKRNVNLFNLIENRPPLFHIMSDNEYYIDLTRITDRGLKNIVNDFKDRFPKSKALIFDLRGFTNISEEFLGMFLKNNVQSVIRKYPVFSKPGGKPTTFFELGSEILPKNPYIQTNVYFLIDERTSGGAEIIAAVAKKYKIGKLIGTISSGTADEVLGINLPGEFNASMVAMNVQLPESKIDFKKGIEPDIEILPTIDGISKGEDEVLEYVYGLLKK